MLLNAALFFLSEGEGMKVDLSSTIAVISAILSVAFAVILAVSKVAYNNREKQIDEEFKELKGDLKVIDLRLHAEEKTTIRQDGELTLTNARRDEDRNDIQEIKRNMATKSEVNAINVSVNQVLTFLRDNRRYPSGSTMHSQPGAYSGSPFQPSTHNEPSIEPPRPTPRRPPSNPGPR